MMNKKGELTTQQIVGLVVLITSFAIILFLLFRLNLGETTDKEICHNSVLMKSKSVVGGSLDCKTNYVCISGGEDCEGINPTITIDVDAENKTQIMKAIANEMADCWWMFGEGKVDYVSKDIIFDKAACSVCSIIEFDENIKNDFGEKISYDFFYQFLLTKKDKTQTYLKYLYNTDDLEIVKKSFDKFLDNYFSNNIDFDKQYFVLTGRFEDAIFSFYINDKSIGATLLEKTEKNYDDVGCDEFLTKS